MISATLTTLAICLVLAIGWSALALVPGLNGLAFGERLAVSCLVGAGCIAWPVHLSLLLSGEMQPWLWYVPLSLIVVAVLRNRAAFTHIAMRGLKTPSISQHTALNLAPVALLMYQLAYVLTASFASGLRWDGLTVWAMKAKGLYLDSTAEPGTFLSYNSWISDVHGATATVVRSVSNPAHPDGLPSLEAWLYIWVGQIDEHAIKIIGPLFFTCTLLIVVYRLMHVVPPFPALMLGCLLASAPWLVALATTGYADIPLAAYCTGATGFGAHYLRQRKFHSALLAAVFGASTVLFKREGQLLAVLFVASLSIALLLSGDRRSAGRFLAMSAGVTALIAGPWLALSFLNGSPNLDMLPMNLETLWSNAGRFAEISRFLFDLIVLRIPADWGSLGLVWLTIAAIVIARIGAWNRPDVVFLGLFCAGYVAIDVLLFVFSAWDPYMDHVKRTIDRLVLQITPAGVLLAGHVLVSGSLRTGQGVLRWRTH